MSRDQIKRINQMCGGSLRTDAEIETALFLGKGKSVYRKIAYLWKAILVGHPFTDGNKRTSLTVALVLLKESHVGLDEKVKERLVDEITTIARENREEVSKIERLIRYAVTGD